MCSVTPQAQLSHVYLMYTPDICTRLPLCLSWEPVNKVTTSGEVSIHHPQLFDI